MRRLDPRLLIGVLFVLGGILSLLDAMGIVSNAGGIFWGLISAAAGAIFLYILLTDRNNWWAAFPAFTFFGLAASSFLPDLLEAYDGLVFFVGISLGFWWVYFTGPEHWWAIIPGGVLLTLGIVSVLDNVFGDRYRRWSLFPGTWSHVRAGRRPSGRKWPLMGADPRSDSSDLRRDPWHPLFWTGRISLASGSYLSGRLFYIAFLSESAIPIKYQCCLVKPETGAPRRSRFCLTCPHQYLKLILLLLHPFTRIDCTCLWASFQRKETLSARRSKTLCLLRVVPRKTFVIHCREYGWFRDPRSRSAEDVYFLLPTTADQPNKPPLSRCEMVIGVPVVRFERHFDLTIEN